MGRTEYISKDPSETIDIGEMMGRVATAGEVYAIYGDLRPGKTRSSRASRGAASPTGNTW